MKSLLVLLLFVSSLAHSKVVTIAEYDISEYIAQGPVFGERVFNGRGEFSLKIPEIKDVSNNSMLEYDFVKSKLVGRKRVGNCPPSSDELGCGEVGVYKTELHEVVQVRESRLQVVSPKRIDVLITNSDGEEKLCFSFKNKRTYLGLGRRYWTAGNFTKDCRIFESSTTRDGQYLVQLKLEM